MNSSRATRVLKNTMTRELSEEWCLALHGNHDEHQCHKKPGHLDRKREDYHWEHECYCGVWW